jgi:hypothetical protein
MRKHANVAEPLPVTIDGRNYSHLSTNGPYRLTYDAHIKASKFKDQKSKRQRRKRNKEMNRFVKSGLAAAEAARVQE